MGVEGTHSPFPHNPHLFSLPHSIFPKSWRGRRRRRKRRSMRSRRRRRRSRRRSRRRRKQSPRERTFD